MKKTIFLLLFAFTIQSASAEFINIGVLASKKVLSIDFSIRAGQYAIFTENGKLKDLNSKDLIRVEYHQG
ncbi:MAG: hypothetical protein KDB74_06370, partial [Flavobacteriales bacterium]|nr:hypothetical protein [Flavobacteriales bacterium]